jgi:hypothetical protein
LTCSATASDDDGDTPTITYAWTNASEGTTLGTGSTLTLSSSTSSADDTITCTATATDADGGTATDSASVTVDNTAPEVTSVTLSPSSVYTNDTITATVTTSDDDGDSVTVSYAWYVDGSLVSATGSTLSGATYFDKDEDVYVIVTPSDDEDTGDSATSDSLTILNTAPEAPEVSIEDGVEDCGYVELDGDDDFILINAPSGDLLSYSEGWTVEGWFRVDDPGDGVDETGTGGYGDRLFGTSCTYNEVTLTSSGTLNYYRWGEWCYGSTSISDGDFHHVAAVTENGEGTNTFRLFVDGEEDCSGTTSDMVEVYDNEMVYIGASLRGDIESCDAWGSTPRAVNEMNGAVAGFRISTGERYTEDFVPPTSLEADSDTVVAYDFEEGTGSTAEDGSTSGVDATLEEGASWGESCVEYGDLVCSIDTESTDDDGDTISYTFEWDVDGTAFTDTDTTTETGDTVSEDSVGYDETWTCTVTPNDADDDGTAATASVTIETDSDSDGYGSDEDCDDGDDGLGSVDYDADCDGVLTEDDCDDSDSTVFECASRIGAGYTHSCGLNDATDEAECWGSNNTGERDAPSGTTFKNIDASDFISCGVTTDGDVECWGEGYYGALIPPSGDFSVVTTGHSFACAIDTSQAIECWGTHGSGPIPGRISSPPSGTFKSVSAGYTHGCGVTAGGDLECWGDGSYGETSPPSGTFKSVDVGRGQSCAINTSGEIECWGMGFWGTGTPPEGEFEMLSVSLRGKHGCAVATDGTVECWDMATATSDPLSVWALGSPHVPPDERFQWVSAGRKHTCGMTVDGEYSCWGNDVVGQCTPP